MKNKFQKVKNACLSALRLSTSKIEQQIDKATTANELYASFHDAMTAHAALPLKDALPVGSKVITLKSMELQFVGLNSGSLGLQEGSVGEIAKVMQLGPSESIEGNPPNIRYYYIVDFHHPFGFLSTKLNPMAVVRYTEEVTKEHSVDPGWDL